MPEKLMNRVVSSRRLLVAVTSGLMLGATAYAVSPASGQTNEPVEPNVPQYQVIDAFDAAGVVEVDVATAVKKEGKLRLIADDLREHENVPEGGTLLVEYYDDEDTSENTGFALVFDDERAVLESGDSDQFGQVYDREDAERIIEEEDGMRVVSYRDFKEDNSGIWGSIKSFLL
ncbi:MAG: hypothetical protein ACR2KW_06560 [Rubrobacter sp.]